MTLSRTERPRVETPADEWEAAEWVRAAPAPFDISGGATRAIGRPRQADLRLSTSRLTGIVSYEPAALLLRARAGTPLCEIEAALAAHNQMLPFEPPDPRVLFGRFGEPTVGGLVATALSGPRRLSAGAVRDNVLGLRLVNGRGEILLAETRVKQSLAGLDLVKISCGALGTLGLITEATFRIAPKPAAEATVVIRRLDDARGVAALARALSSPYEVSGAALIHAGMGRDFPRTLLRVEGSAESVSYRAERLIALLADFGAKHALVDEDSNRMWRAIRDGAFLAEPRERAVWRASLQPGDALAALASLGETARASLLDHGGGTLWFSTDPTEAAAVATRAALARFPGNAELIRAPAELRARVDVFAPLSLTQKRDTRGVKQTLDPRGLFNPGRMYADI